MKLIKEDIRHNIPVKVWCDGDIHHYESYGEMAGWKPCDCKIDPNEDMVLRVPKKKSD